VVFFLTVGVELYFLMVGLFVLLQLVFIADESRGFDVESASLGIIRRKKNV